MFPLIKNKGAAKQLEVTKIPTSTKAASSKKQDDMNDRLMGDFRLTTEMKADKNEEKLAAVLPPEEKRKKKAKKKSAAKLKKSKLSALKVAKSAQDTIPYIRVYKNGIFQSEEELYTKTYELMDTNFKTATQEHQDEMYFAYG